MYNSPELCKRSVKKIVFTASWILEPHVVY